MSRRSQNRNQYESETTGELDTGFSVTVKSTAGLITDQDMYVVIEPDVPGQREWFLIESITGNTLNIADPNGRNLEGTDNGHEPHPAGSKVRSVPTQQIFEDIFQDAEDDELALTQHRTSDGDPHANAGYLNSDDGDQLYVELVGDTMVGFLVLSADPTIPFHAATKQYVDEFREVDADLLYLTLVGGTMAGDIDMGGNDILNSNLNENFVAITRGLELSPQTVSVINDWVNFGPSLNMGDSSGQNVWVTCQVQCSTLSASGAESVSRIRIGISQDGGGSYNYGSEPWGVDVDDSRRHSTGASHFLDIGVPTSDVRIQAQVLLSAGVNTTFEEGTVTAVMARTDGKTS